MRVVIAGGHGKIALILSRLLAARGDEVVGLIRNPAQTGDVEATGARAVVCDLESAATAELAPHLVGADAVVFAAGAGPGSGAPRKDTVDRGASVLLADAATAAGVRRYVQISSINADKAPPPGTDDVFAAYLRAKKAAEDDLRARPLDWTILRPGRLTDDPPAGTVRLAEHVDSGAVTRADVAAVVVGLLDTPASIGAVLELVGGDTPVDEAVATLPGRR
ncbi:SDR family oxidoreductase [Virgisporangium ochraceum]|uniref:NAD-dependent dehydratase n=1 Tax=Virgisporangium ochraceum TaxID=65505 RepID=A0A8J4EHC4_9ACTN|nr:SDR family oxidoreductase [Virgisporangium ochraceum]GIJ74578.1 NAD-dependent dehydratase [Virgisporangium ochraceum]